MRQTLSGKDASALAAKQNIDISHTFYAHAIDKIANKPELVSQKALKSSPSNAIL
jgi:hypothetical protein